ncbi:MAG: helix-turn-helix transcriptional regulator [Limnochordia bacterium]
MPKRTKLIALRGSRSRREVALALGITPQMLGMIERGDRNPSRKLTKRMAEFYGVSADTIIFFIDGGHKPLQEGDTNIA